MALMTGDARDPGRRRGRRRAAASAVAALASAGVWPAAVAPVAAAAPAPPSPAQLARMVLPEAAIGPSLPPLTVHPGSGAVSNAEAGRDAYLLGDDARGLAARGRLTGYSLQYADPSGRTDIGTSVSLFASAGQAARFVPRQASEVRQLAATLAPLIDGVREVPVPRLGDGRAASAHVRFGGRRFFIATVTFRRGPLVATVDLRRPRPDARGLAVRLARALDRRIAGVLGGTISDPPVAIPRRPGSAAGGLDLRTAALRYEDLPAGFLPDFQGFLAPGAELAVYHRSFATTGPPRSVAGSRLARVEATVELSVNLVEAASKVAVMGAMSARALDAYGKADARHLGAGPGARVRVTRLRAPRVGDQSVTLRHRIATPGLAVESVHVYFRVGPLVGLVVGYGLEGGLRPGGVVALARAQAAHIRAALAVLAAAAAADAARAVAGSVNLP
jgi:hypothetical protein